MALVLDEHTVRVSIGWMVEDLLRLSSHETVGGWDVTKIEVGKGVHGHKVVLVDLEMATATLQELQFVHALEVLIRIKLLSELAIVLIVSVSDQHDEVLAGELTSLLVRRSIIRLVIILLVVIILVELVALNLKLIIVVLL